MKKSLLILTFLVSISSFAQVSERDISEKVHKYQCNMNLDNYKFKNTFENLFSSTYLNEDISLLDPVIKEVDEAIDKTCTEKGYFSFQVQDCFNSCGENLKTELFDFKVQKKKNLRVLCSATCTSIYNRSVQLHTDAFEIQKM